MLKRTLTAVFALLIPLSAFAHGVGQHADTETPGLTEIVGGIGWIVGILGLIAYLKSRQAS